jgi:integrase
MAVKLKQRKGKWWVYIDHNGKRKAKCVGDKRAAQHVADTIAAKLKLGELALADPNDEKPACPFDAYFRNWLDTYVKAHCKDSTFAGYESAFRLYLEPRFRQKDINQITREDVKQLAYELLTQPKPDRRKGKQGAGEGSERRLADEPPKTRSRSYVKGVLVPLSEMFNHAIEDGHFTGVNPALRVLRRTRIEAGARHEKVSYLTGAEVATLLKTCREHFAAWYPFVLTLTMTGVRVGEAVAFQWGDFDLPQACMAQDPGQGRTADHPRS